MLLPEIDSSAMNALIAYSWPGNVRELRNVAERLVLEDFQHPVMADDLRLSMRAQEQTEVAIESTESGRTAQLWEQFEAGMNFWTVVYQPFKRRELTRHDVTELIHGGLSRTAGSYRSLLGLFNLPADDYKRFHAFLRQQNCTVDVRRYRHLGDAAPADQRTVSAGSLRDSAADSRR